MVSLQPLTESNRAEVEALCTSPAQERFVSSVVDSLLEAAEEPGGRAIYWAVYDDETPVGFVMIRDRDEGSGAPRRVLGIDLGERRIGVAVGDLDAGVATPLTTLTRGRSIAQDALVISRLASEQRAAGLVVGLPLDMDGGEGQQAIRTREWAMAVAGVTGLPVRFAAERIRMTLEPGRMHLDARYEIANRTDGAQALSLLYPFPIDGDHPYPDAIEVVVARDRRVVGCSATRRDRRLHRSIRRHASRQYAQREHDAQPAPGVAQPV